MKIRTVNIVEKETGKVVAIEGDMMTAMRACVNRNVRLRDANMRGEWRLQMDFHLHPSEYEAAIKHWAKS